MNRVMLLGNLGADPELRFGQGPDTAVLKLRLATTESYFDRRTNERKERTDWHNVVVFGKRGEALQKILQKGATIFVEGRLQTGSYEKDGQKHYRTDVVATNVILTGRGGGAPREEGGAPRGGGGGGGGYGGGGGGGTAGGGGGGGFRQERPAFTRPQPAQPSAPSGGGDEDFPAPRGDEDDIPF
jgi:single-strand DNA-binding protein